MGLAQFDRASGSLGTEYTLWYANSDYFFTTHPLISMEDIIQVEKRIGAMQRQGGTVAYRRRIGNEEDYIEPSACSE